MNEWTVVLVVIALVGLVTAIATPMIKLNTLIVQLTTVVKELKKTVDDLGIKNRETHDKLWEHVNTADTKLADHEARIKALEMED